MNKIQTINTEYLRPSRTIDTIIVENEISSQIFIVYNYEGISFRVFKDNLSLINFFLNKSESDFHFKTEKKLDYFLLNTKIMT